MSLSAQEVNSGQIKKHRQLRSCVVLEKDSSEVGANDLDEVDEGLDHPLIRILKSTAFFQYG